jgi:hypothetical protein
MKEISMIYSLLYNLLVFFLLVYCARSIIVASISLYKIRLHYRMHQYIDYHTIILSPFSPGVTIIYPLTTDEPDGVQKVKHLMNQYYSDNEIIVIPETSALLHSLIEKYELEKVIYYFEYRIPCRKIRGIYRSKNLSFRKLLVVDNQPEDFADACNAGINVAKKALVTFVEPGILLKPDALLHLVKPFLEQPKQLVKTVVAFPRYDLSEPFIEKALKGNLLKDITAGLLTQIGIENCCNYHKITYGPLLFMANIDILYKAGGLPNECPGLEINLLFHQIASDCKFSKSKTVQNLLPDFIAEISTSKRITHSLRAKFKSLMIKESLKDLLKRKLSWKTLPLLTKVFVGLTIYLFCLMAIIKMISGTLTIQEIYNLFVLFLFYWWLEFCIRLLCLLSEMKYSIGNLSNKHFFLLIMNILFSSLKKIFWDLSPIPSILFQKDKNIQSKQTSKLLVL